MSGPMDRLFGHSAYDLNRDGKISGSEWAFISDTFFESDNNNHFESGMDNSVDKFEMAGIDRDELVWMDEDSRRESLEDAGLNPDDFDEF